MLAGDVGAYAQGESAAVTVRVRGAPGGRLELVEGAVLDETAARDTATVPWPRIAATLELPAQDDAVLTWAWTPSRPSWLYARVLEKLDLTDYAPRTRDRLEEYFRALERVSAAGSGGSSTGGGVVLQPAVRTKAPRRKTVRCLMPLF